MTALEYPKTLNLPPDLQAKMYQSLLEVMKISVMYVELADQLLSQVGKRAMPGITHNRAFAEEWGRKAFDVLKTVQMEVADATEDNTANAG